MYVKSHNLMIHAFFLRIGVGAQQSFDSLRKGQRCRLQVMSSEAEISTSSAVDQLRAVRSGWMVIWIRGAHLIRFFALLMRLMPSENIASVAITLRGNALYVVCFPSIGSRKLNESGWFAVGDYHGSLAAHTIRLCFASGLSLDYRWSCGLLPLQV